MVSLGLLILIVLPAAIIDIRQHRIPNTIPLLGIISGLVLNVFLDGLSGLGDAAAGLALLFALGLPFYLLGWFGAGDVKLIAAIGAIAGLGQAPEIMLGVVLSGAAMGIAALAWRGVLGQSLRRFGAILGLSLTSRRPTYVAPSTEEAVVLPYGVAIAVGSLIIVAPPVLAGLLP